MGRVNAQLADHQDQRNLRITLGQFSAPDESCTMRSCRLLRQSRSSRSLPPERSCEARLVASGQFGMCLLRLCHRDCLVEAPDGYA